MSEPNPDPTLKPEWRELDDKGRCCGRKPLVYKRDGHKFCTRCDRAYNLTTGRQIGNFWYAVTTDGFVKVRD